MIMPQGDVGGLSFCFCGDPSSSHTTGRRSIPVINPQHINVVWHSQGNHCTLYFQILSLANSSRLSTSSKGFGKRVAPPLWSRISRNFCDISAHPRILQTHALFRGMSSLRKYHTMMILCFYHDSVQPLTSTEGEHLRRREVV